MTELTEDTVYDWAKNRSIGDEVESDDQFNEKRVVGRIVKFWGGGHVDIETESGETHLVSENYMTPVGMGHLVLCQKPWLQTDSELEPDGREDRQGD